MVVSFLWKTKEQVKGVLFPVVENRDWQVFAHDLGRSFSPPEVSFQELLLLIANKLTL
jgi:hypothetical protein